jgi:rare lipoprotein A
MSPVVEGPIFDLHRGRSADPGIPALRLVSAPRSVRVLASVLVGLLVLLVVGEGCATTAVAKTARVKHKKKKRPRPGVPVPASSESEDDGGDTVADLEDLDEDLDDGDDDPALTAVIVAEGSASFYHDTLAGRRTANGERYNPEAQTCAHKTLPFGTILLVEDIKTGKSVHCRVNDHGPYVEGRVVDLSRRSARDLGILERGVARVRVRVARPPTSSE